MREASQDANKAEQSEDGPKTEDADQGIVCCYCYRGIVDPFACALFW